MECETATSMGIPFDESWYKIDLGAREMMLANKVIRATLGDLRTLEINARGNGTGQRSVVASKH